MANAGDPSAAATDASAAAPPSGAKKKEKTQEELSAEKQKEWSERVQKAQDEIKSLDAAIARNERGLASMYNVTPARADLAASIDSDKKKVAALRQTLASLEDERRRLVLPRHAVVVEDLCALQLGLTREARRLGAAIYLEIRDF